MRNKKLIVLAGIIALAIAFHLASPNIPESDSFYYLRLASLYKDRGIFNVDFPWIYHSVVRELSSSIWYGFGVFSIPFTFFKDLITGIKVEGIFLTVFALSLYYFVLRRHKVSFTALWPFLLFFAAPNSMFAFLMTRPQMISLPLAILLFSLLIKGPWWGAALASFGIAWFHLNFAWLPLIVLGAVELPRLIIEKRLDFKKIGGVLLGIILGFLLRPEFLNAVKLFYIQIFKLIFEQQSGLPLLLGAENLPLSAAVLFKNFGVFLVIWVFSFVASFIAYRQLKNQKTSAGGDSSSDRGRTQNDASYRQADTTAKLSIAGSALTSLIFFILAMVVARKAYSFWLAFGLMLAALIITHWKEIMPRFHRFRNYTIGIIAAAFIFLIPYSSVKTLASLKKNAYPPDYLEDAALWLEKNSDQGDIVFNVHWAHFSPLFFNNQKNYYSTGLDPIFTYVYEPSLYWKFHYLSTDQVAEKTCGAEACTASMLEDTYDVLTRDFGAKYVILSKEQNPNVYAFLGGDERFSLAFEGIHGSVFSLRQ